MIHFDLKIRMKSFLVMKLHLNAISALVHLANNTRPNIRFAIIYSKEYKTEFIGYADAQYLFDPHKALSQERYVGDHFFKSCRNKILP